MKYIIFKKEDTYEDIKNKLAMELAPYYDNSDENVINKGILSFKNLKDDSRLVPFLKKIDQTDCNACIKKNKVYSILYGMILLDSYKDFTDKLSDEALVLLSHNFGIITPKLYEIPANIDDIDPSILETIVTKTKDVTKRDMYLQFVDKTYDCKKQNKEYINEKIKNMTDDELRKIDNLDDSCIEEVGQIAGQLGIKL